MLFDLRGKRRRRGVQAVYLTLAVLMGGGLVFFGIGGATGGGLFDAINGSSGGTVDTKAYDKKVAALQAKVAAAPKDPIPLAALTRAQFQQASVVGFDSNTNRYTAKGQELLQSAAASWQKYLALKPDPVDDGVAGLMVQAYSANGLNDTRGAVEALQAQIDGRGPSSGLYSQLAVLAYLDGNVRQSTLAEKRALALAPERRRRIIQNTIDAQRKQINTAKLQQAASRAQQQKSSSGSAPLTPGG